MKIAREQLETLILEQLDLLYRAALRLCRNAADAEDLVQETCVRALRAGERFDLQAAGIRPWLLRILRNLFLTRLQQSGRRGTPSGQDSLEFLPQRPATNQSGPWSSEIAQQLDGELARAVQALPEEYRSVLTLWALEDFSYAEIAEALEIPMGTVMSRLHRARARLAQQLEDYARREGIRRE